ncbi:MAG: hypothetical protein KDB07_00995, partial [Planctomycetes bacterium]|nr:hypothetical protein [Planctomycetota bacterium]
MSEPRPADDPSILHSLQFLGCKALAASVLFRAQAKKRGEPLGEYSKLFAELADAAQEALKARGQTPSIRWRFEGMGMTLWGIFSRQATRKFCLEMATHLLHKA